MNKTKVLKNEKKKPREKTNKKSGFVFNQNESCEFGRLRRAARFARNSALAHKTGHRMDAEIHRLLSGLCGWVGSGRGGHAVCGAGRGCFEVLL